MATMKQIAQLAGVSRGTVDRVLNNRGIVNEQTAQKVREIAESLQYTPSKAARSLAALKRNIKLTYIMFDPRVNHFFQQVEDGIRKKAAELQEYGVTVEILYSNFSDPDSQNKLLDQAVAGGTSGIAIAGFNSEDTAAKLRRISEAGIPVVTSNTDISDCKRIAFVGSNYFRSGQTAAGLMRLITQGHAKVGVLIGSYNVLCHTERVEGFISHIAAHAPGIEVVSIHENSDEDFESFSVTKSLLEQHPDINALFLASGGVYGACRAVEGIPPERRPLILCYDCPQETRGMIEKGVISAAICQQPERQGSKPLDILFNYIAMGAKLEKENYYTEINIIIRENL